MSVPKRQLLETELQYQLNVEESICSADGFLHDDICNETHTHEHTPVTKLQQEPLRKKEHQGDC